MTGRTLGLTVPIAELLDPELWRQRYAYGLVTGLPGPSTATTQNERLKRTVALAVASQRVSRDAPLPREEATAALNALAGASDDFIRWHLRVALSALELKLSVPMGIQICKADPVDPGLTLGVDYDRKVPRLPYVASEALLWYQLFLPSGVISVERVRGYYFGQLVWEISNDQENLDLIRLTHPRQGVTQILPTHLQSIAVTQDGNYGIWETIFLHTAPVPDFWAIDYTIGPITRDGKPGEIEVAIANWVYAKAGMSILTLGGLAQTKGLTSASVSLDGASKNVSFQSSSLYDAAVKHYAEVCKDLDFEALRTAKRGLRIRGFGSR
jgi:hypothetical protein